MNPTITRLYRGILLYRFEIRRVGGVWGWKWYRNGFYHMCNETVQWMDRFGVR